MSHCVAIHGHNATTERSLNLARTRMAMGFPRYSPRFQSGNFGLEGREVHRPRGHVDAHREQIARERLRLQSAPDRAAGAAS